MYVDKMKEAGGLFSVKIDLTGAYDDEATKKELCDPETEEPYVLEFRELSGDEFRELVQVDKKKQLQLLGQKVGECLINHNLKASDGSDVSKADALEALEQYGSLFYYVVEQWQKQIPLLSRSAEQSTE